jgi:hypothetical protein
VTTKRLRWTRTKHGLKQVLKDVLLVLLMGSEALQPQLPRLAVERGGSIEGAKDATIPDWRSCDGADEAAVAVDEDEAGAEGPPEEEAHAPWQLSNNLPLPHGHGDFAFTLSIAVPASRHSSPTRRCLSSGARACTNVRVPGAFPRRR